MPRYFFALWPDKAVRKKIVNYRSTAAPGGKPIPEENLHITLLFMGKLNRAQLQKVISATMKLKLPGFCIQLNQTGHFSKSKVSWLGLKSVPDALVRLHNAAFTSVHNSQVFLQQRQYIPHLTLARKSPLINTHTFRPIDWSINHFVLIESTDTPHGVHYEMILDFPLQAGKD